MAITPLWMAGAEFGNLKEFDNTFGSLTVSTTQVKTGTYSFRSNNSGACGDTYVAGSQMRAACHIYPTPGDHTNGNGAAYFQIMNSTSVLAGVYSDDIGVTIKIVVSGSVVETLSPMAFSTWQHWGFDWKADAAAGWFNFYIDGVVFASYSGNTGTTASTKVRWLQDAAINDLTNYTYIDDLYIDDTTGEAAPLPPPDKRFLLAIPSSDTAANWTPSTGASNFALVDEIPTSATDYVSTTASGTVDTYGVTVPTYPTGYTVAAVWPTALAFKSDGGTATELTLRIADGVTDDDGASQSLPTTQGVITERFPLQPDGSAWNNADFEAWSYGIVSSGTF